MARKRVRLALVENESNRRSSFKKRKASFFKKLSELSTLCAVPACAIVYNGPNDSAPATWPNPEATREILTRFAAMPDADQTKHMLNVNSFLQKQVSDSQRQLKKIEDESANLESEIMLNDVLSGRCKLADVASPGTLNSMSSLVATRLKTVSKRLDKLKPVETVQVPDQQAADVAQVVSNNNWVSQVVGPIEGLSEAVPDGMLRPRADVVVRDGLKRPRADVAVSDGLKRPRADVVVSDGLKRPRADVAVSDGLLRPRADVAVQDGLLRPMAGVSVPDGLLRPMADVSVPDDFLGPMADVAVPVGLLRPRADVMPASESFLMEESDKKYWAADVAQQDDDWIELLNFVGSGDGFF